MSTRGLYTFRDEHDSYTVYCQCDNYPSGAVKKIEAALKFAWELPRFEADEFAASFVAAEKPSGGGQVRLLNCQGDETFDMGQEYHYIITCKNKKLHIEFEGFSGDLVKMKKFKEEKDFE